MTAPAFCRYQSTARTADGLHDIMALCDKAGLTSEDKRVGQTLYERYGMTEQVLGALMGAWDLHHRPRAACWDDDDYAMVTRVWLEAEWARLGKPYVKVWPDMVSVLRRTPPAFPVDKLRFPFPSFETALPVGSDDFVMQGHAVGSMLVRHDLASDFEHQDEAHSYDALLIVFNTQHVDGRYWSGQRAIDITGCATLAELAERLGDDHQLCCFIAGVAMLLTSDPAYCEHDLSPRTLRRLKHKDRAVRKRTRAKLASEGRLHGYRLGASIRLPLVTRTNAHAQEQDTGRHLEWGHLRRAHFGWRKTRKGWRLRPIRMARVRPDLPLQPSPGYETPPDLDVPTASQSTL